MAWSGTATIEPGRLIFGGRLGAAHAHAHAAVQIAVASQGSVGFTDASGGTVESRWGIIPSGIVHAVDAGTATGMMIYLDPTSSRGRGVAALVERCAEGQALAWTAATQRLRGKQVDFDVPSAAADTVIGHLLDGDDATTAPGETHPSVSAALTVLPDLLSGPVRLTDVARAVHLSADRLGRLFARDVGLSFPAYVRWARLIRAIEVSRVGGTITEAAHAAGFTDSSHANRAFHEMFGIAPIDAFRNVRLT